jgi:polyisoprenoid-binding protein YceI
MLPVIVILLAVLLVGGPFVFLHFMASKYPDPYSLPTAGGSSSAASSDGTWKVVAGSEAGYRAREQVLLQGHTIAGRTKAVSGTTVVKGSTIMSGSFEVDLSNLQNNGKAQPGFSSVINTASYPKATFTLKQPVTLAADTGSGREASGRAPGELTVNGVTQPATFTVQAQRQGDRLEVAGSAPVDLATWKVEPPSWALLARISDQATAEFLIIMEKSTSS